LEDFKRVASRVGLCGSIQSGSAGICSNCGKHRVFEFKCNYAHFCKVCAKIKARAVYKELISNLLHLNKNIKGYRTKRLKFLTLSSIPFSDVEEGRKFINQSFDRLLRRKKIKDVVFGSVSSIEAEKSKDSEGKYHVHIHAILYSKWLPVRDHTLSKEWEAASKGKGKIVYVEQIKGLNNAVKYIANYVTKNNSMPFKDKFFKMFGKRFFFRHGCFNKGSKHNILVLKSRLICLDCGQVVDIYRRQTEEGEHIWNSFDKSAELRPPDKNVLFPTEIEEIPQSEHDTYLHMKREWYDDTQLIKSGGQKNETM